MVVLKKIVILGGGLTGLSAANMLKNLALRESAFDSKLQVTLVDKANTFGGHLRSKVLSDGNTFLSASRSVKIEPEDGEQIIKLVSDIGLGNDVLVQAKHKMSGNSKNLFGDIFMNGKFYKQRTTLSDIFFNKGPLSESHFKIFMRERFTTKRDPNMPEETVHEFFARRFGIELSNVLMSANCRANYFSDCNELGMNSVFPNYVRIENEFGSLTKTGYKSFLINSSPLFLCDLVNKSFEQQWDTWTLKNGMDSLPSAIEKHLQSSNNGFEAKFLKNTVAKEISFVTSSKTNKPSVKVNVETDGKSMALEADYVINCLPNDVSAQVFPKSMGALIEGLNSIKKKDIVYVQMSFNPDYSNPLTKHSTLGFSFPKGQDIPFLKLSLDSCLTPYKGNSIALTGVFGSNVLEDIKKDEDVNNHLSTKMLSYLRKVFGSNVPSPRSAHVEVCKNSWPVYDVKHHNHVSQCRQQLYGVSNAQKLPVSLAGFCYDGLTTSKRVVSGNKAAEEAVDYLI